MKKNLTLLFALLTGLCSSTGTAAAADDLPHVVQVELGDAEFAPGDNITITEVRGTSAAITTNETYTVTGTYALSSRDEADLAFFVTVPNSGPSKVDPKQRIRIAKGTGTFSLSKTMEADGYPHVSFYPLPSGSSFGGVYFGQGQWALRNKGWSSLTNQPGLSQGNQANQAIFEYLGEPVAPPPTLDRAYSAEGLQRALLHAAHKVGVSIVSVRIDDSEFPFLLGVVSNGNFDQLGEELKKMDGYDYTGSVGYETRHAFNIIPWRVFPPESGQRIGRRLTVRQQILYDKISGQ